MGHGFASAFQENRFSRSALLFRPERNSVEARFSAGAAGRKQIIF
jgi:hypothetical protein